MGKKDKAPPPLPPEDPPGDPRVEALVHIGWISISLLGISIPLSGILAGISSFAAALLPLSIIAGALTSGILIWSRGGKNLAREERARVRELEAKLAALEERLENVETIDAYESKLAEKTWNDLIVMDDPRESNQPRPFGELDRD